MLAVYIYSLITDTLHCDCLYLPYFCCWIRANAAR